jgi:hypothetical protein
MKLQVSKSPMILTALACTCAAVATVAQVNANMQSDRAEGARRKALRVVAQHVVAESCLEVEGNDFRLGQKVVLEGGKSPTACFVNSQGQYAFAGYLDGELQITQVFSQRELDAAKSMLKKGKNK